MKIELQLKKEQRDAEIQRQKEDYEKAKEQAEVALKDYRVCVFKIFEIRFKFRSNQETQTLVNCFWPL